MADGGAGAAGAELADEDLGDVPRLGERHRRLDVDPAAASLCSSVLVEFFAHIHENEAHFAFVRIPAVLGREAIPHQLRRDDLERYGQEI